MRIPIFTLYSVALLIAFVGIIALTQRDNTTDNALSPGRQPRDTAVVLHDSCCGLAGLTSSINNTSVYRFDSYWIDQNGRKMRLAKLAGKTRVIAMFYSHCTSACPVTINDMKRIEAALPAGLNGRVGFVLVSFDVARDTPQTLQDLCKARGLNSRDWTLLTGKSEDVRTLAAMLGVEFEKRADGNYNHSNQIAVLDPDGEIVCKLPGLNQPIHELVRAIENCSE